MWSTGYEMCDVGQSSVRLSRSNIINLTSSEKNPSRVHSNPDLVDPHSLLPVVRKDPLLGSPPKLGTHVVKSPNHTNTRRQIHISSIGLQWVLPYIRELQAVVIPLV